MMSLWVGHTAGNKLAELTCFAVMLSVGGCAAPSAPTVPGTQQADVTVAHFHEVFDARLLGTQGCPVGSASFSVPWQHSPGYSPLMQFIVAPPAPAPICAPFPASLVAGLLGKTVRLERVGSNYRLASGTELAVPTASAPTSAPAR